MVAASRYEVVGQLDYSTVAHDSARVMIISSRKGEHVIATVDKTLKFRKPQTLNINVKDKLGITQYSPS